jgi:hypothetical protein
VHQHTCLLCTDGPAPTCRAHAPTCRAHASVLQTDLSTCTVQIFEQTDFPTCAELVALLLSEQVNMQCPFISRSNMSKHDLEVSAGSVRQWCALPDQQIPIFVQRRNDNNVKDSYTGTLQVSYNDLLLPSAQEMQTRKKLNCDLRGEHAQDPKGDSWVCAAVHQDQPLGTHECNMWGFGLGASLQDCLDSALQKKGAFRAPVHTGDTLHCYLPPELKKKQAFDWMDVVKVIDGGQITWWRHQGWQQRCVNMNMEQPDFEHPLTSLIQMMPQKIRNQAEAMRLVLQHIPSVQGCWPERLQFVTAQQHRESVAALHNDAYWNLCLLLYGEKTWYFLDPEFGRSMKNGEIRSQHHGLGDTGGKANEMLGITPQENPDFPWYKVVMQAGDVLCVPPDWWHYVVSSKSGAVSMCAFWHPESKTSEHDSSAPTPHAPPPVGPITAEHMQPPVLPSMLSSHDAAPTQGGNCMDISRLLNAFDAATSGALPTFHLASIVHAPPHGTLPALSSLPPLRTLFPSALVSSGGRHGESNNGAQGANPNGRTDAPDALFNDVALCSWPVPEIFTDCAFDPNDCSKFDFTSASSHSVPARTLKIKGFAGGVKDGAVQLQQAACEQLFIKSDQGTPLPMLFVNCFSHKILHLQKNRPALKNARNYQQMSRDLQAFNKHCACVRAIETTQLLMLQKWVEQLDEQNVADIMQTYFDAVGGVTPRCFANIAHRHSIPSCNNGLEGKQRDVKRMIKTRDAPPRHVRTLQDMLGHQSRMNGPPMLSMNPKVWDVHFWSEVKGLMRADLWGDESVLVSIAELCLDVPDLPLEHLELCNDADAECTHSRPVSVQKDVRVDRTRAFIMPTGLCLGWLTNHLASKSVKFTPEGEGASAARTTASKSTVTRAEHVKALLTGHEHLGKRHTWLPDVRKLLEDPAKFQEERKLDFDQYMDVMLSGVVLVPVSDQNVIDRVIAMLENGVAAKASGKGYRGCEVDRDQIARVGHIVRCMCSTYLHRGWCVHVAVWMIHHKMIRSPDAYDTAKPPGRLTRLVARSGNGRNRIVAPGGARLLDTPQKKKRLEKDDRQAARQQFQEATGGHSRARNHDSSEQPRRRNAYKKTNVRQPKHTQKAPSAKHLQSERKRKRGRRDDDASEQDAVSEAEATSGRARRQKIVDGDEDLGSDKTSGRSRSRGRRATGLSDSAPPRSGRRDAAVSRIRRQPKMPKATQKLLAAMQQLDEDEIVLQAKERLSSQSLPQIIADSRLKDLEIALDGRSHDSVGLFVKPEAARTKTIKTGEVLCVLSSGPLIKDTPKAGDHVVMVAGGAQRYEAGFKPTEQPLAHCGGAANEPDEGQMPNAVILQVDGIRRRNPCTLVVACIDIEVLPKIRVEILTYYGHIKWQPWAHRTTGPLLDGAVKNLTGEMFAADLSTPHDKRRQEEVETSKWMRQLLPNAASRGRAKSCSSEDSEDLVT